ncbi:MAG: hypothetical protein IPK80_04420 [Nannocystis sp.]|nr:hypothetical protein [Nannocystis sp.]
MAHSNLLTPLALLVVVVAAASCGDARSGATEPSAAPARAPEAATAEAAAPEPAEGPDPSAPAQVVAIGGGIRAICVVVDDGRVRCVGDDVHESSPTTANVDLGVGDRRVVEVALLEWDLCARRFDGGVVCRTSVEATNEPLAELGAAATSIEGGMNHACALLSDRRVACWGHGQLGQLGDGRGKDSAAAVVVAGLDDAIALALGWDHSCALRSSGEVVCWGANELGQLGGPGGARRRPQAVPGIADATAIASSMRSKQTCALRRSGAVSCWGSWGMESEIRPARLGKGPIDLPPLADVVEVAVNTWMICGRQASGAVHCWDLAPEYAETSKGPVYGPPAPIFPGEAAIGLTSSAFAVHLLRADMTILIHGELVRGREPLVRIDPLLALPVAAAPAGP